jgi:ABC-type amino acid transport substrate-binding protein
VKKTLALLLAMLAVPFSWNGAAWADGLDDIKDRGQLVVAVYRDFPPFSSRKDGEVVGIDVDIAGELAKRLGLKPSIMELTADESVDDDLRNAVWKGHYLERRVADAMLHIPTDKMFRLRNTNVVIFAPYFRERVVVARNPDRVVKDDGVTIFETEKVGVELATLADVYLTAQLAPNHTANVVHYPTITKAVEALRKGEVAAVMGNETEILAALGKDVTRFPAAPMPAAGLTKSWWELGLAVKDSNRQLSHVLDDAMAAMLKDGTIAAIFKRHGLPHRPPED